MIVDRDIHPNRNLFYIGAKILLFIQKHQFGIISTMDLFEKLLKEFDYHVSFDDFMLSLDWLFILGAIDSNEKGDIKRCF